MTIDQRHDGGHHDWHSTEYVNDWISNDVTRDSERAPMLRRMLSLAALSADAAIEVLDVGAGYGLVSRIVLEAFPRAHVTLQDYSLAMLEQARRRLAPFGNRTKFVQADLTEPAWTETTGGPFDLAVYAIAIHNLRNPQQIAEVYKGVYKLLKPDGVFLDSDYVFTGGLEARLDWLKQAGFVRVSSEAKDERLVILAAYVT